MGSSADGSADVNTLFLALGQGGTAFAGLCEVTIGEEFQESVVSVYTGTRGNGY